MTPAETIGVDLGGTKMLVGVVAPDGSTVHRRVARSAGLGPDAVLALLEAELELALAARPESAAIGLGVPCTIDRDGGVCVSAVNLPLIDVPVRDRIAARFGLPVSIDNDGNVAAIAEARLGAARGARDVVLLTIGTGIGGGLILDGRPYRGAHGAGAELGHVVVDIDGPPCQGNCPNRGCIEAIASGTALAREAERAAAAAPGSELARAAADGAHLDGRLVTELARAGEPESIAVLETAGRRLGVALSGLANIFDPEVIVVGGGVMAAGELLLGPAREELRVRALPPQNRTPVLAAGLGADAGMIGAAILAADELGDRVAA
ncbi:MAG TPA: ROK family protein [Solirubrobacterales bacterium]|nr:ROK family protein [Solirubrobacterales bacterium]